MGFPRLNFTPPFFDPRRELSRKRNSTPVLSALCVSKICSHAVFGTTTSIISPRQLRSYVLKKIRNVVSHKYYAPNGVAAPKFWEFVWAAASDGSQPKNWEIQVFIVFLGGIFLFFLEFQKRHTSYWGGGLI
jgi:hypothetical protein